MKKRYVVTAALALLALVVTGAFFAMKADYSDTRAQSFGEDYARIAVYPEEKYSYDGINALRVAIDSRLISDSHSAEGRLWYDGFISFGNASVSTLDTPSFNAQMISAGGDFFTLYDLEFISGTPFRDDDNYSDRVVIDERAAFKLYGNANCIDMPLYINSREYYVAGVFRAEEGKAWEMQFGESPCVIIPDEIADSNLYSCYEIVMPNPVDDYALTVVTDAAGEKADIVDVTNRNTFKNLFRGISDFTTRSYVVRPISYPWFENTARGNSDALSLMLLFSIISLSAFAVSGIYLIIRRKK